MNAVAQTLYMAGFRHLVSVSPPDAQLSPGSKLSPASLGKVPARKGNSGWYGYAWDKPEHSTLDFATEIDKSGANIGLRATRFPALDIDSEDPDLTLAVIGVAQHVLGPAPQRMSREPRRLLMYRVEEGVEVRKSRATVTYRGKKHGIEILGAGQQYVIRGTHPSGTEYKWATFPTSPDQLSAITPEKVDEFWSALTEKFEARGVAVELEGDREQTGGTELPDTVIEGGRNVTLAQLAGTMRRVNMSFEAALTALQQENESRCRPPLPESEVEAILRSIWRYKPDKSAQENVPADAEFSVVSEAVDEKTSKGYTLTRMDRTMQEKEYPAVRWLVDDLLPVDELSVLAAKPKVGKSTLARALAVAVADGRRFLDREVTQGDVLYLMFPGEGSERSFRDALDKLGYEWGESGHYIHLFRDYPKTSQAFYAWLEVTIKQLQPRLVIVDTVQKMTQGKDYKDYGEVAKDIMKFAPYATNGVHFMLVTHTPKNASADPVDAPIGSIQLSGSAEVVMHLHRGSTVDYSTRYLNAVSRDMGDLPEAVVQLDPETTEPVLMDPREYHLLKPKSRILAHLREAEVDGREVLKYVDGAGLERVITGKNNAVRDALRELIEEGAVIEEGSPLVLRLADATDDFKEGDDG